MMLTCLADTSLVGVELCLAPHALRKLHGGSLPAERLLERLRDCIALILELISVFFEWD